MIKIKRFRSWSKYLFLIFVVIVLIPLLNVFSYAAESVDSRSITSLSVGRPYYLSDFDSIEWDTDFHAFNSSGDPQGQIIVYDRAQNRLLYNGMFYYSINFDGNHEEVVLYGGSGNGDYDSISLLLTEDHVLFLSGNLNYFAQSDGYQGFLSSFSVAEFLDLNTYVTVEDIGGALSNIYCILPQFTYTNVSSFEMFYADTQDIYVAYDQAQAWMYRDDGGYTGLTTLYLNGNYSVSNGFILWDRGTYPDLPIYFDLHIKLSDFFDYFIITDSNIIDYYGSTRFGEGKNVGYEEGFEAATNGGDWTVLGDFLFNSVKAFLNPPLFYGFSIGSILTLFFGASLFLFIFKLLR